MSGDIPRDRAQTWNVADHPGSLSSRDRPNLDYSVQPNSAPNKPAPELTHLGHFVNGFLSNAAMICLMQPAFTWKTYAMSGLGFPPRSKWYKGGLANCASAGSAVGVAILVQHAFMKALDKETLGNTEDFVISSAAGAISAPLNSVCERAMIQQQLHEKSVLNAMKPILLKEGVIAGLFKGVVPTMCRDSIFNCGVFAFYNTTKKLLNPYISNDLALSTASGMIAGSTAGILSTPFDLTKTVIQGDTQQQFNSMIGTARHIYKTTGVKGLFAGAHIRAGLIGGVVVTIVFFKEAIPHKLPQIFHKSN